MIKIDLPKCKTCSHVKWLHDKGEKRQKSCRNCDKNCTQFIRYQSDKEIQLRKLKEKIIQEFPDIYENGVRKIAIHGYGRHAGTMLFTIDWIRDGTSYLDKVKSFIKAQSNEHYRFIANYDSTRGTLGLYSVIRVYVRIS